MLTTTLFSALAAATAILSSASPVCGQDTYAPTNLTTFKPPVVKPFLHLNLLVDIPVNVTTVFGDTGRYSNRGGNVTGAFEGSLLPIGTASEILPPASNGTVSFFTNAWTINTTDSVTILMDARATITYANEALHGFGSVTFSVVDPRYIYLNWGSYVVEFEGNFNTGTAIVDVFELETGGHRDGSPILALLPPGVNGTGN